MSSVEDHVVYEDGPPPCVGQWCCGCAEHPIGKPWGWNWAAWDAHNMRYHREDEPVEHEDGS